MTEKGDLSIAEGEQLPEPGWGHVSRNPKVVNAILALNRVGRSQSEIARVLGICQSTVCRVLSQYSPHDDLAVLRAKSLSVSMIESLKRAARHGEKLGRHGAAATVLQAAKVLGADARSTRTQVIVQIGAADNEVHLQVDHLQFDRAKADFRSELSPDFEGEGPAVSD